MGWACGLDGEAGECMRNFVAEASWKSEKNMSV